MPDASDLACADGYGNHSRCSCRQSVKGMASSQVWDCRAQATSIVPLDHSTDEVGSSSQPLTVPVDVDSGSASLDAAGPLTSALPTGPALAPAVLGSAFALADGDAAGAPGQATIAVPLGTLDNTDTYPLAADDVVIMTRKVLSTARKAARTTSSKKPKKKPAKKSKKAKKKAPPHRKAPVKKPTPRKKNEFYECGVFSTVDSDVANWAIESVPMKCVETDQDKYPNFYFACFCTDNADYCAKFADDIDYAVHHPEVNNNDPNNFYWGDRMTIEDATEFWEKLSCPADPSCTIAINAGVGGLAGCGGD